MISGGRKFLRKLSAGGQKEPEDEYDVFVSWDRYAEGEAGVRVRQKVDALLKDLRQHGVKVCGGPETKAGGPDQKGADAGGGAWTEPLQMCVEGTRKSSGVLVLLTKEYIASVGDWKEVRSAGNPLKMEFAVCIGQHSEGAGGGVHPRCAIPVVLDETLLRGGWGTVGTFLRDVKPRTAQQGALIADDVERLRLRARERHGGGRGGAGSIVEAAQQQGGNASVEAVVPAMLALVKVEVESIEAEALILRREAEEGGKAAALEGIGRDVAYVGEVFKLASYAADETAPFHETLASCIRIKGEMRDQEEDLRRRREEIEASKDKMERELSDQLERRRQQREAKKKERGDNDAALAANDENIRRLAKAEEDLAERAADATREGKEEEIERQLQEKNKEFEGLQAKQKELERRQKKFDEELRRLEEEEEQENERVEKERLRREEELQELERRKEELLEMEEQKARQIAFNYEKWKKIKELQKNEEAAKKRLEKEEKELTRAKHERMKQEWEFNRKKGWRAKQETARLEAEARKREEKERKERMEKMRKQREKDMREVLRQRESSRQKRDEQKRKAAQMKKGPLGARAPRPRSAEARPEPKVAFSHEPGPPPLRRPRSSEGPERLPKSKSMGGGRSRSASRERGGQSRNASRERGGRRSTEPDEFIINDEDSPCSGLLYGSDGSVVFVRGVRCEFVPRFDEKGKPPPKFRVIDERAGECALALKEAAAQMEEAGVGDDAWRQCRDACSVVCAKLREVLEQAQACAKEHESARSLEEVDKDVSIAHVGALEEEIEVLAREMKAASEREDFERAKQVKGEKDIKLRRFQPAKVFHDTMTGLLREFKKLFQTLESVSRPDSELHPMGKARKQVVGLVDASSLLKQKVDSVLGCLASLATAANGRSSVAAKCEDARSTLDASAAEFFGTVFQKLSPAGLDEMRDSIAYSQEMLKKMEGVLDGEETLWSVQKKFTEMEAQRMHAFLESACNKSNVMFKLVQGLSETHAQMIKAAGECRSIADAVEVESWLPQGVSLDPKTGVIRGTVNGKWEARRCKVTAANPSGETSCSLEVWSVIVLPEQWSHVQVQGWLRGVPLRDEGSREETCRKLEGTDGPALIEVLKDPDDYDDSRGIGKQMRIVLASELEKLQQEIEVEAANQHAPSSLSYALSLSSGHNSKDRMLLVVDKPAMIGPGAEFRPGNPQPTFTVQPPLPAGLLLDRLTGGISGVPQKECPTTAFKVTASNTKGACTATVPLEVQQHVAPTTFSYASLKPRAFAKLHQILVCGVPANHKPKTDGTWLTFSVSPDLPAGLALDPSSGAITGSPVSAMACCPYTVTGSNSKGRKEAVLKFSTSEAYDENAVHDWSADHVQLWLEKELELDDEKELELFAGIDGAVLAGLQSSDAGFWQSGEGKKVNKKTRKLVQSNAKDLVEKRKDAEERKVLNDQEKDVLRQTAGAGRSVSAAALSKFDEFFSLRTGRPKEAAGGLETRLGVSGGKAYEAFHSRMGRGVEGIKEEVAEFVADAVEGGEEREVAEEEREVAKEKREVAELLDYILHQGTSEKAYDNGIRDHGRPEGLRLEYFASHEKAKGAGLSEAEVVAMRLYTTKAYKFMNDPLRDDERASRSEACPLSVSTYHAERGIKKLRALNAPDLTRQLSDKTVDSVPGASMARGGEGGTVSQEVTLWRGMRSVKVTDEFLEMGGTELAFMSTTTNLEVAVRYALSGQSLLFKIKARDFMVIGADIQWLSAFPAEREVLYPPLTYLRPTGKTEGITIERDGKKFKFVVVEVEPAIG